MALSFNAQPAARTSNAREERPKTEYWINLGIVANDGTFVGLPVGLPLDTMAKREIRGSNQEWNALTSASNSLLDMLLEQIKELAPGQEELIDGLHIQVKRVKAEAGEVKADVNPFLAGFQGITARKPQVEEQEQPQSKRKQG